VVVRRMRVGRKDLNDDFAIENLGGLHFFIGN
jgi:hypothetical protein